MFASLIGRWGSSASRLSTTTVLMSLAGSSASLPESALGPSIMGFEDEVEQSFRRPWRQTGDRSKRTYDLTSSIVREAHHSTRSVEAQSFLLLNLILRVVHACCRDLFSGSSGTQYKCQSRSRCMITANRRARATISFSNRPFWVKRFQTIHHYSVDVARGLALLFGIGTEALPAWDSKTRWNNL